MLTRLLLLSLATRAASQACSPNCPYEAHKHLACSTRTGESAVPAQGYALTFGPQMVAATKTRYLDASNAEISKLGNGFTMMAWLRWNDVTVIRKQSAVTMGTNIDSFFWKPLYKLYEFSVAGRNVGSYGVDDWKIDGMWHHVTASWNNADGAVKMWIDGQSFRLEGGPRGIGDTFLDKASLCVRTPQAHTHAPPS